LWTQRLAQLLRKYSDFKLGPVSGVGVKDCWRLLGLPVASSVIRVGFRPGQLRPRGLLIDVFSIVYMVLFGRLIFYWIGSDVQRTLDVFNTGRGIRAAWGRKVGRFLMGRSGHLVAAPWLVNELETIGVKAICVPFPSPTAKFSDLIYERTDPIRKLDVLTYIPDHNFKNYCGAEVVEAARHMPKIRFAVMGGRGAWCENPPDNIEFLGWTDAGEQYLRAAVVVRAVHHDALGGTVREALMCGCHVIYSFPHPCTIRIDLGESSEDTVRNLIKELSDLDERCRSGRLMLNHQAREWVLGNLSEEVLMNNLIECLRKGL